LYGNNFRIYSLCKMSMPESYRVFVAVIFQEGTAARKRIILQQCVTGM
jgi:hypothetical protein